MNNLVIPINHLVYNPLRLLLIQKHLVMDLIFKIHLLLIIKNPMLEILIIILLQILLFGLEIILKCMIEIIKNYKMF